MRTTFIQGPFCAMDLILYLTFTDLFNFHKSPGKEELAQFSDVEFPACSNSHCSSRAYQPCSAPILTSLAYSSCSVPTGMTTTWNGDSHSGLIERREEGKLFILARTTSVAAESRF